MFDISKLSDEELDAGSKESQEFIKSIAAEKGKEYALLMCKSLQMREQVAQMKEHAGEDKALEMSHEVAGLLQVLCVVINAKPKELLTDADKLRDIVQDEIEALKKLHGE